MYQIPHSIHCSQLTVTFYMESHLNLESIGSLADLKILRCLREEIKT